MSQITELLRRRKEGANILHLVISMGTTTTTITTTTSHYHRHHPPTACVCVCVSLTPFSSSRAVFERVTKNIKVMPGSEFRAAAQEGMKYGARIVLGDRPVEVRLLLLGAHNPSFVLL
jgi:hypothetical protein